ncbi:MULTISPECIES: cytochrome P450 [unclassified Streptomyces]|uniref:cytochrome P450 n=1 Tax=unclassified Streptomyces TaxID=2593676 RepID=UPI001371B406|nr:MULTISPECIES: cytochrome P450 [unclassified Streptomyces]MCW5249032.1 cytochrome P450 [Streptomyces sp. SHP 1-2]MYU21282.1 cytochrome P450 [Streptomyces sp. SID8352]
MTVPPEASELPPSFDPNDPVFRADPYPIYSMLRQAGPAHRGFLGMWTFVRYEECSALLRDHRLGKDFQRSSFYDSVLAATQGNPPPFLGLGLEGGIKPLFLTDPPEHTRLRALVGSSFSPSLIRSMTEWIDATVDELLDAAGDRFDLVEAVADPLATRVLGKLLGVPVEDQERFREWNRELTGVLDLDLSLPPEVAARRRQAITDCNAYFHGLAQRRRTEPGPDLVSALVQARENDDALSDEEIAGTCALLMAAASETSANLISSGAMIFARRPGDYARLVEDPSIAATALEEILRCEPPAHVAGRIALERVEVGDIVLEPGESVMLVLASANRDEARFPDGDAFVVDRGDKGHLSFGAGIHYCMGAPLARSMAESVLRGLAARHPKLALDTDEVRFTEGTGLRGPASLPLAAG